MAARATREEIYQALFLLGSTATVNGEAAFVTASRRWVSFAQVTPDLQPAFFQVQRKESPRTTLSQGMPPVWTMHVDWFVYVNLGADLSLPPSSVLNPILDALETAVSFAPPFQTGIPPGRVVDYQRLGFPPGSVQEVRIMSEDIEIVEGLQNPTGQSVAVIPVRITRT